MRRADGTGRSAAQRLNGRVAAIAVTALFAGAVVAVPGAAAAASSSSQLSAALYAKSCKNQSKKRAGLASSSYSRCVTAMTALAQAKSRSPLLACATLSRKRIAGTKTSAFARCVAAGRSLIRLGNGIDLAFVEEMVPHHVSAVAMAQYALDHAQSDYLRTLAASIIRSQNAEIATMRQIAGQLRAAGIRPVSMGLTKEQMGMDHDSSHLIGANPFDVAFIDMMIPHHEGAITMSTVLLAKGVGTGTKALAQQIRAAQTREIQEMRAFRQQIAGGPLAPGDVGHG